MTFWKNSWILTKYQCEMGISDDIFQLNAKKTRGTITSGFLSALACFLRDQAGRHVVYGNREVDQADGEESDDGFHGEPPSCVFYFQVNRLFPLSVY